MPTLSLSRKVPPALYFLKEPGYEFYIFQKTEKKKKKCQGQEEELLTAFQKGYFNRCAA